MKSAEIDKIFFEDGYRLADEHIGQDPSKGNMFKAIRMLYESMDGLLESLCHRSVLEGKAVECQRGCSWCCHHAVFAVSHELVYAWAHAVQNLENHILQRIRHATDLKNTRTRGKPVADLLRLKIPCPFLDKGVCSVYAYRPMACRIYLSTSRTSCQEEFHDPQDEQNIPALLEFPLQAGRMMNEGFVARLRKSGINSKEMPLEQGIFIIQNAGPAYDTSRLFHILQHD